MSLLDHFALWNDNLIVVIDVETTGFSPDHGDKIIEIAAVLLVKLKVQHVWHRVVNPGRPIPADASRVHGFYDEDVAGAEPFSKHRDSFLNMCAHAIPCAYHESFDRRFVLAELGFCPEARALEEWPAWVDPLVWVRSIDRFMKDDSGNPVSNSLAAACKRYGVETGSSHGALADATATAGLLAAISGEMPRVTASELIRRQGDLSSAHDRRKSRTG